MFQAVTVALLIIAVPAALISKYLIASVGSGTGGLDLSAHRNSYKMTLGSAWTKSSRSFDNGNCVEVRRSAQAVEVRDSKDPSGGRLRFNQAHWQEFIEGIRQGEFDRQ